MKAKRRCILLWVLLSAFLGLSAVCYANSAPLIPGEKQYGVVPAGADELEVEREILTFDIPLLSPQQMDYYNKGLTLEDALSGPGTVTAEYHFYNPTEETIQARMAFAMGEDQENKDVRVLVDGEETETENRYTIFLEDGFYGPEDAARIQDSYMEDSFLSPDLPVFLFSSKVKNVGEEEYFAKFGSEAKDPDRARPWNYQAGYDNGRSYLRVSEGDEILTYVFGDAEKDDLSWILEDGPDKEIRLPVKEKEKMTFLEFTRQFQDYPEDISDVDRYNIIAEGLRRSYADGAYNGSVDLPAVLWYAYAFDMESEAHRVNSVTAALAPQEHRNFRKSSFTYTYYLSPAQGFDAFGPLDIYINTPYELSESGDLAFEKTDSGYELHLETLPEGELEFTLAYADKKAENDENSDSLLEDLFESGKEFFKNLFGL